MDLEKEELKEGEEEREEEMKHRNIRTQERQMKKRPVIL